MLVTRRLEIEALILVLLTVSRARVPIMTLNGKSRARLILAVLVVLGILVTTMAVLRRERSFAFVGDNIPTLRIAMPPSRSASHRTEREIYSFEVDFNDVCAEAHEELLTLGFSARSLDPMRRTYHLTNAVSGGSVVVTIRGGRKFTQIPSNYSYDQLYAHYIGDGKVVVDITRRRLRVWPPRHFLNRLKQIGRSPANNPPSAPIRLTPVSPPPNQ